MSGEVREKKSKSSSSKVKTKKKKSSSSKKDVGHGSDIFKLVKGEILNWQVKLQNDQDLQKKAIGVAVGLGLIFIFLVFLSGGSDDTYIPGGATAIRGTSSNNVIAKQRQVEKNVLQIYKIDREKAEPGFDVSGSDWLSIRRRFGTREEYEKAQTAGRQKLSAKDEACFKNMPVQIVRDDPSVFSVFKPRKVFDLAVLERTHKKLGYVESTDYKKASLILKGQPRVVFRQLKEGKQYYDMVASLGRIGSKKKTQLSTLRNHVRKFKCSFESLHIQPRSYDMNKPTDCKKFFSHPDKGQMWVLKSCKSGEGSKGQGISVIDDLSETRAQWGDCQENAFNYVSQAYIEQPLLLINRKFDMRVYLFVASTKPYVVFFNPGYIRRSLSEYKPTSTKKEEVLTNFHIQVDRKDFTAADAMWSFPQFIQYLKDNNQCMACGDIEMKLAQISKLVFDSGRPYYKRFSGSFQLVGLDFMMDQYLNVMFIEGNVSPGIGNHGLKWKRELMEDLVGMMYQQTTTIAERPQEFDLRIGERVYGKYNNYWELIVNEHFEKCNKQHKFDPCKELKPEGVEVDPEDLKVAEEVDRSSGSDDDAD